MTQTNKLENKLAEAPRYTLLRSRFAYRIPEAVIHTNGYDRRVQEMLDDKDEHAFINVMDTSEEKWDLNTGKYVLTNTSRERQEKGEHDSFLLQIGRIDVIYPHQHTADQYLATASKESMEKVGIEFRMANLHGLVEGNILMHKSDEQESKDEKLVRLAKSIERKHFLSVTNAKNAELSYRLGLPDNEPIITLIVPILKIPELYLVD